MNHGSTSMIQDNCTLLTGSNKPQVVLVGDNKYLLLAPHFMLDQFDKFDLNFKKEKLDYFDVFSCEFVFTGR